MEFNFELIKRVISIISTGVIFLTFIIATLSTNKNNVNFIEYTDLSKLFINFYTAIVLLLIFLHSINPKYMLNIIEKNFGIVYHKNGKLIVLSAIFISYFGTGSLPQKNFGMISFFATFILFLSEYFLKSKDSKRTSFVEEKNSNTK